MKNAEEKEKAKILFDAKKKAGLHKPITYNRECGLSKQEWELDNLADEIVASDSSLERIGILRKFMEQYATIREKEILRQAWNMATVQTLVEHCDNTTPTGNFEKLDFEEWYTKHKEG